jgi:hypothetical protein
MAESVQIKNGIVVINSAGGHTVISRESLLKRLHYFDGKFLRAADLNLEQQALLNQVRLSNQASGSGVVHGYSCTLASGDRLVVGPGLAIDPVGRVLSLPQEVGIGIAELIEKSQQNPSVSTGGASAAGAPVFGECEQAAAEAPDTVLDGVRLYLITVGHAEAYCGEEDVYGKLCEEACITSTQRPYVIEGVVLRAVPLILPTNPMTSSLIALSSRHLRSRVASVYFAAEQSNPASLVSGDGLASSIWCLGAEAEGGAAVPIGVLARAGSRTVFLDAWIARRERMETPPRRYWAGRLAMRPWNVFLAQVLQFQCQLASCFAGKEVIEGESPCAEEKQLAAEAAEALAELMQKYNDIVSHFTTVEGLAVTRKTLEVAPLNDLRGRLSAIASKVVSQRYLIDCGIVELPSAGYLPVDPTASLTVNEQVRRLTGNGLDLRFCVVRPDYIPHALEEAQHMERISLLAGIDDQAAKPKVDVLVPDGRIEEYKEEAPGTGYAMDLVLTGVGLPGGTGLRAKLAASTDKRTEEKMSTMGMHASNQAEILVGSGLQAVLRGAARGEELPNGGSAFYYAAQTPASTGFIQVDVSNNALQLFKEHTAETASNVLELIKSAAPETEKARATTSSAGKATLGTNRMLANTLLQRLSSGLRINTRESRDPSQAIWLSFRADEDPFALERGNAVQVSAQAVFLYSLPLQDSLLLVVEDLSLSGQLRLDAIDQRAGETRLTCRLKADGILNYTVEQSNEHSERAVPLKLDEKVVILRTTSIGPRPAYRISVINPSPWAQLGNIELRFERSWTDSSTATIKAVFRLLSKEAVSIAEIKESANALQQSMRAKAASLTHGYGMTEAVSTELAKNEVLIFSGQQKIDNDALKPGHALHDASLSALARLGAALNDNGFADFSARQLFPPPRAVPDELRVFARHDWVLFHRRRDKACGFETAPEALVQPRRFRIFQAGVASDEERVLLRNALVHNQPEIISRFRPQAVTIVEFEAGIQTVRTSPEDVRADWLSRVDDNVDIVLGVVATRGAAYDESQVLAEARLNSLTGVLAPVAGLAEDVELLWAEQVPDTLASGEVDGIIVYATQEVATVCHEVFRLELSPEQLAAFLETLQASDNFRTLIQEFGGVQLGFVPKFRNGAAQLFGDTAANDLIKAWGDAGNNQPVRVVPLVPVDADGSLPGDQPYMEQSQAIADTVGKGADSTDPIGLSQPFLKCPAVTLLVVEPQAGPTLNTVYGYVFPSASTEIDPQDIKNHFETEGLPDDFPASKPDSGTFWYPLGSVSFDADNNGSLVALNTVATKAIADGLLTAAGNPHVNRNYYVVSLSKQGVQANQISRDKAAAEQIAGALNLSGNVITAVHGKASWPGGSEALTLVLIPNPTYFNVAMTHRILYAEPSTDTSPTDEDVVAGGVKTLHYDQQGELIKDLAFEAFVTRLKKQDTLIKTIEVVTTEEPVGGTGDPRAEKTLAALKEAGAAMADAVVNVRIADAREQALISRMGGGVTSGLVLRK